MERSYTCDEIYRIMEQEIIDLRIKPGAMLSEHSLCQRFSASRTPIRSVLQRLQENGLVQIMPYKGTMVTLLDFDIINQIIYQRVAVETMVLRDFAKTCNPLELEQVRYALNNLTGIYTAGNIDIHRFYAADSRMHEIWFRSQRKMYLWECFQKAQSNYSRFRMLDIVEANNFGDVIAEHAEMLRIIEHKDCGAIEPLMQQHLFGGIRRLGHLIFTDFKDYFVSTENPA
ncbi:MAG: GntR family transcriptional regulator [Oscillospiraceae bacterium]